MYCLCQVLTFFMMFVFFENVGPQFWDRSTGRQRRVAIVGPCDIVLKDIGRVCLHVKHHWNGYILYICGYLFSIKPVFEQAGAFEFVY